MAKKTKKNRLEKITSLTKNKSDIIFSKYFSKLTDPRIDRTKQHSLEDIIIIAICGTICGADGWTEIEEYGKAKFKWLKTFLLLPNGIPSHDTFGRVFSLLDPEQFQECFLGWVQSVVTLTKGEVVAIDGKTLRKSFDKASEKAAIHMVSAWANTNRMVLGQVKVDDKSNEITAIPKLLKLLDISGSIITIDAMGCQKKIATVIKENGADYVLALKENQPNLYENVSVFFDKAIKNGFGDIQYDYHETKDKGHGRIERRCYWKVSDITWVKHKENWDGLNSIGMVESHRCIGDKESVERRYYINSIKNDVKQFAHAVRSHWGIENSVHWVLDIAFREDESRVRKDNSPQNLAMLRHIALNLIKQEKSIRYGIKKKRLKSGWDNDYLLKVLFGKT